MRVRNGIIAFVMGDLPAAQRLLSLEVTNTFPIVRLGRMPILLHKDGVAEELVGFDHISIPADLRLHMTHDDRHVIFDVADLWTALEREMPVVPHHLFTHIGLPFGKTDPLVAPGSRKRWQQAAIVSPLPDNKFGQSTRLFIDFFIHSISADQSGIENFGFVCTNMRLARDHHGSVFGPFEFSAIQRHRLPVRPDLGFSLRFGYTELEDNDSTYTYSPLSIYARRDRRS
jgi:hypothetical protein